MPGRTKTLVLGGGVAGLLAAYELTRRGIPVTVLEAAPTAGGAVARHQLAGVNLDAGADSFATRTTAVADLLTELGIAERITQPAQLPAWVRHATGMAPLPRAALLGVPGYPTAAEVRRVIGGLGAFRAALDSVIPRSWGGLTLGELVARRMGRRVVARLVAPVAGGVYGTDPYALAVDAVAPQLPGKIKKVGSLAAAVRSLRGAAAPGAQVAGIRTGMATLPQTLVERLAETGVEVQTNTRVYAVTRRDATWEVETNTGRLSASRLVCALPGPELERLLTPNQARGKLPTTAVALVTLVVDAETLDAAPRGTGVLVAPDTAGIAAKALTHVSAKWPWLQDQLPPGRHVLRLSYGRGGAAPPPDSQLRTVALADATNLLGVPITQPAVVDSAVVRWSAALPHASLAQRQAVTDLLAAAPPDLLVVGATVAGTGLAAVVADTRRRISHWEPASDSP